MNRCILGLVLLPLLGLAGCTEKLVKVQPYEMEPFSQDKMLFMPIDSRTVFEMHIFSIREGSAGGLSGFQGGCGCR